MFVSILRFGLLYSYAISTVRIYSTYNKYSIVFKAVLFGPMGPWRPRSTSHYFSSVWSGVTDGVTVNTTGRVYVLAVRLRTIRVIGGLFFGSEAAAALYRGFGLAVLYMCIC